jgi:hypothetical protein
MLNWIATEITSKIGKLYSNKNVDKCQCKIMVSWHFIEDLMGLIVGVNKETNYSL